MGAWLARRWPVLLVLLGATILRWPLMTAALGGFHAYNEGFYAKGALAQAQGPLLDIFLRPVDLNNMPLFSWVLTGVVALFGRSEFVIRVPSLIASLASIYLAGLITEELVDKRYGWLGAAFVAMTPVHMLVGTNAQPDMMMVAFAMAGLYAYVRAYRGARAPEGGEAAETRWRLISGALLGLSILTKLNGILMPATIAVWETVRRRDLKWTTRRSALGWFGLWLAIPASWFVVESLVRGPEIFLAQGGLAQTLRIPNLDFVLRSLNEGFFQLGPPIAIAFIAGLLIALVEHKKRVGVLLWLVAIEAVFWAFYHFHAYYMILLIIGGAIVGVVGIAAIRDARYRTAAIVLVLVLALPISLLAYEHKLPAHGVAIAGRWVQEREPGPKIVVLPKLAWDNSLETFRYYMPNATFRMHWPDSRSLEDTHTFVVFYNTNAELVPPESWMLGPQDYNFLVLFGHMFSYSGGSVHWFEVNRLWWRPVGPIWRFGLEPLQSEDLKMLDTRRLTKDQLKTFRDAWNKVEIVGDTEP
jgi:4-amino-4-deoxy-L-arabinose transferase-like glycosyltransferase